MLRLAVAAFLTGALVLPASAADKSSSRPNVISIPKSPGSIEGLGESFEANLNAGSVRETVPIAWPPGTGGLAPSLALAYGSGFGNGPLGAEDRIDRVAAYAALLADGVCEIRRTASRRLGEIGDPAALPALRRAAAIRSEVKGVGLFGKPRLVPACGAPDADAVRRIEAVRLPTP